MIVSALFFYLFAGVCIVSAFMVIAAKNPVHSVLYLIFAFVNASGLFVMMGAEFLAMILVVVYVGAVAVLFLFVVMMLDVDFAELRQGFLQYLPIGALVGIILLAELLLVVGGWVIAPEVSQPITSPIPPIASIMSLGLILLALNLDLLACSSFLGHLVGQVVALLVLTVAAAEAAIGLAILVVYFLNRGSIAVEDINLVRG